MLWLDLDEETLRALTQDIKRQADVRPLALDEIDLLLHGAARQRYER